MSTSRAALSAKDKLEILAFVDANALMKQFKNAEHFEISSSVARKCQKKNNHLLPIILTLINSKLFSDAA